MSKTTKLTDIEAEIVKNYFCALYSETTVVWKSIDYIIDILQIENAELNNIRCQTFAYISSITLNKQLLEQLSNIVYKSTKIGYGIITEKVSTIELRKLKIDIEELPKKLEQYLITFYNKLIEIGTDVKAIETSKAEVLKSIKNMYFLTNRIKEVIESKV